MRERTMSKKDGNSAAGAISPPRFKIFYTSTCSVLTFSAAAFSSLPPVLRQGTKAVFLLRAHLRSFSVLPSCGYQRLSFAVPYSCVCCEKELSGLGTGTGVKSSGAPSFAAALLLNSPWLSCLRAAATSSIFARKLAPRLLLNQRKATRRVTFWSWRRSLKQSAADGNAPELAVCSVRQKMRLQLRRAVDVEWQANN